MTLCIQYSSKHYTIQEGEVGKGIERGRERDKERERECARSCLNSTVMCVCVPCLSRHSHSYLCVTNSYATLSHGEWKVIPSIAINVEAR